MCDGFYYDCRKCVWYEYLKADMYPCNACTNVIYDAGNDETCEMFYEESEGVIKMELNDIIKIEATTEDGGFIPEKAHTADAGYDLRSPIDVNVPCYSEGVAVDLKLHMNIPFGYFGDITGRSGLGFKHGIEVYRGIVDSGYTGSIKVKLKNNGESCYRVKAGDKIAQMIITPCVNAKIEKVDQLGYTDRGNGGFGSTGR